MKEALKFFILYSSFFIFLYLCAMKFILQLFLLFSALSLQAQSWGDQGDGTFRNPVLPTDLSDPDVIRVGEKYYMVASDFHFVGMQILESSDLVNWHVVTQLYHRFDHPGWDTMEHYGGGSWAPSIRWHKGRLWVYFCTPDEGLFMTNAERAEGPWSPLVLVKGVKKWEDPCPFWDDDGKAYLGHSLYGAGPIILHRMSDDGTRLLDDGVTVYTGPVAEGTKLHKWNGYYYLSIPEGGVCCGWQTILRSKNIYGPYERKVVLEQGTTDVNGPHQGAIVDTPEGSWWFFHFQEWSPLGRIVHLQPVRWEDGWPLMGVDSDGNGIGEPVAEWPMPVKTNLPSTHASDVVWKDDFSGGILKPEWQWNHNPHDDAWSLTENAGRLTLHALQSADFVHARNTLTLRTLGYQGTATVELDFSKLAEGMCCGIACMGKKNHLLGIRKTDGKAWLYTEDNGLEETSIPMKGQKVFLRLHLDAKENVYRFEFSNNGRKYRQLGKGFYMRWGNWKGARIALYAYNNIAAQGTAIFDNFVYETPTCPPRGEAF